MRLVSPQFLKGVYRRYLSFRNQRLVDKVKFWTRLGGCLSTVLPSYSWCLSTSFDMDVIGILELAQEERKEENVVQPIGL